MDPLFSPLLTHSVQEFAMEHYRTAPSHQWLILLRRSICSSRRIYFAGHFIQVRLINPSSRNPKINCAFKNQKAARSFLAEYNNNGSGLGQALTGYVWLSTAEPPPLPTAMMQVRGWSVDPPRRSGATDFWACTRGKESCAMELDSPDYSDPNRNPRMHHGKHDDSHAHCQHGPRRSWFPMRGSHDHQVWSWKIPSSLASYSKLLCVQSFLRSDSLELSARNDALMDCEPRMGNSPPSWPCWQLACESSASMMIRGFLFGVRVSGESSSMGHKTLCLLCRLRNPCTLSAGGSTTSTSYLPSSAVGKGGGSAVEKSYYPWALPNTALLLIFSLEMSRAAFWSWMRNWLIRPWWVESVSLGWNAAKYILLLLQYRAAEKDQPLVNSEQSVVASMANSSQSRVSRGENQWIHQVDGFQFFIIIVVQTASHSLFQYLDLVNWQKEWICY